MPALLDERSITDRAAVVGVVALGYVGLPLLRSFFDAGFTVMGFDVDPRKIESLQAGENYLRHLGESFVKEMAASDRVTVTADMSRLSEPDALLICVPTPLGPHLEPDLQYVETTARSIAATLRKGQLVVLESTTYPGTTRDVMLPILEAHSTGGLKCGADFFVAYSPEREDPGRKDTTTSRIPKLVGGIDAKSGELATLLYQQAIATVIPVASAEVAEAAKILENVYRAVNIALVNEMKVVLDRMGIDVWQVIDAAATKPFGYQPFYPGPGLGGHCIPIDPFYLTWKARELGVDTQFIELAGRVNRDMPRYVVRRAIDALSEQGKPVKGARILILGLAYKPNVDDVRESPSFELIEQLAHHGAHVDYHDPHIERTHSMRHYPHLKEMTSVALTPGSLSTYDCVLIATHHDAVDYRMLADHAKLVIDTRGVMRKVTPAPGSRATIVQA